MRYVLMLLAALSSTVASAGDQQRVVLDVENMTCAVCPITVKKALGKVPGVTRVTVDYAHKTATVDYDSGRATAADLITATTNAGYPASTRK